MLLLWDSRKFAVAFNLSTPLFKDRTSSGMKENIFYLFTFLFFSWNTTNNLQNRKVWQVNVINKQVINNVMKKKVKILQTYMYL